ncbi:hypothetical protein IPG41_02895 [Candidatus Peregrinibacteria bacterium]|nr:MAG: hypothetical protein IPG41_02895 [Candidatus Peregrinibacteria bacterium]
MSRLPFFNKVLKALFLLSIAVFFQWQMTQNASAATRTWDGGGSTNNWSDCVNWSNDTCPTTADVATFDATSVKNATLDNGFTTGVTTFNMNTGYTGIITQGRSFVVSGNTTLASGTFNGNSDALTFTGSFGQSGGAFNGGAQNVLHTGAFTISGGAYTASSSTTTFAAAFTHTIGGTFSHNNGTVVFTGAAATINVATTETFQNLQVNKNNAVNLTISSGDTLVVNDTTTLTNGGLGGTGTLNVAKSISVNSGWDGSTTGTISITGTDVQSLSLNGDQARLAGTITLNNPNFTINGTGSGTLNFNILNLQAGILDATGFSLSVASTFSQSGGTFTGGSGTVTHTDDFTLSAGTYTATSGTTDFAAGFTHTAGGTFSHNEGTVVFSGGAATVNVATSETFKNLQINKNNATNLTISAGDTLIVGATTTLTNGGLGGTGTLNVAKSISVDSGWDGSTNGTINITGTDVQSLSLNGDQARLAGTITLNNPNFTINGTGSGTLNFNILNLQAGTVNATGFNLTVASTFSQSGGVFTGGSGTITHTNNFTLSGGTYTASSGTTNFAGDFTRTAGGTFTHNNGSIVTNGGASAWDVTGTETLHNLTINTTGTSILTVVSGDTLVIEGTLLLQNGQFSAGTLSVQGDMVEEGTWDGGTLGGEIKVEGTGTQTVTLNAGSIEPANTFTINNSDATVNAPGSGSAYFWLFNLSAGTFNGNGATITIDNTFTQSGGTFNSSTASLSFSVSMTQSGGAFNGSSGTVTYAAGFTLSAGTYTASSGTTYFQGNFTHTAGGTFSHNNGTVEFNTAGDSTYNVASSETFNHVTLNKAGSNATISSGDTFIVLGNLTLSDGRFNTGTLEIYGDVSVGAAYDAASSPMIFRGSATQIFTLGIANSINGDLTINKNGGSVQQSGALILDANSQDLLITLGTYNINGSDLSVNGTSGTMVVQNGGIFQLQGGESITLNGGNPSLQTGSLVKYNGAAGPYTLKDFTYKSLEIAGGASSIFALPATLSIGENLSITSGILRLAGNALTVTGTFSNTGTLQLQGGESVTLTNDSNSGTVEYVGDGDSGADDYTLKNWTYYHLSIATTDANDSITASTSPVDINGNLSISNGTFVAPTVLNLSGNFARSGGTFNPNSGTVVLNGGNQSISGTLTFNNLSKITSSSVTLTLPASTTLTITGTLTLKGVSGQLLALRSSSNDMQAVIDAQGSRIVEYLDIKDNSNINATAISCGNCVNSLNNNGWNFNIANISVSAISGNTTEAGGTATFTVVLDTEPSADVSFNISSSDTSEGTVSPSSLTFTSENWDTPQTVTVTGVNDAFVDGDISFNIVNGSITSADGEYNGLNPSDVSVTNTDNDIIGLTIVESGGNSAVTEGGATDSYTVVLNTEPTDDVTVSFTVGSQISLSSPSFIFTPENWDDPQTLTITAVNDAIAEGAHSTNISQTVSSSDPQYDGLGLSSISVAITDNDTAGLTVSAISGNVSEAGTTATFTVVLTSQPIANVSFSVMSSDTTEGTVSPSSLTFTSENWSTPQTVTVTGANDFVVDGSIAFSIVNGSTTSDDLNYSGINVNDVSLNCSDNDVAGFSVSAISGNVSESGNTATYTVVLISEPTDDVSFDVESSDLSEGTVSPNSLTFDASDWNIPQTVTVTGVNDDNDDGTVAFTILNGTVSSDDSNYNGLSPSDVSVNCTDDDSTSITLTQSGGNTAVSEAGTSDSYSFVLTSQPSANVIITFTGNSQLELSENSLTFTPENWDAPQILTVQAANDFVAEGPHSVEIFHSVNSDDSTYNGFELSSVNAAITDNDVAGFSVSAISGEVTETGTTATYTVMLTSQPTAELSFNIVSSDPSLGTVSPSSLSFNSSNWSSPQTVTVTGVNDFTVEGTSTFTLVNDVANSMDSAYNNLNPADVSASRTDNDLAGITLVESADESSVTEGGATDSYTLVLDAKPSSEVSITLTGDPQISLSSEMLIFTPDNWNLAQTITITAVNDSILEEDDMVGIGHTVSSSDLNFDSLAVDSIFVTVNDNDVEDPEEEEPTPKMRKKTKTVEEAAEVAEAATVPQGVALTKKRMTRIP